MNCECSHLIPCLDALQLKVLCLCAGGFQLNDGLGNTARFNDEWLGRCQAFDFLTCNHLLSGGRITYLGQRALKQGCCTSGPCQPAPCDPLSPKPRTSSLREILDALKVVALALENECNRCH